MLQKITKSLLICALLIFNTLLLNACGGGGSSDNLINDTQRGTTPLSLADLEQDIPDGAALGTYKYISIGYNCDNGFSTIMSSETLQVFEAYMGIDDQYVYSDIYTVTNSGYVNNNISEIEDKIEYFGNGTSDSSHTLLDGYNFVETSTEVLDDIPDPDYPNQPVYNDNNVTCVITLKIKKLSDNILTNNFRVLQTGENMSEALSSDRKSVSVNYFKINF